MGVGWGIVGNGCFQHEKNVEAEFKLKINPAKKIEEYLYTRNSSINMEFIDDHNSVFLMVFPEKLSEELDLSWDNGFELLEDLNPSDAIEVADHYDEIDGFVHTWISRIHYFVCSVPGQKGSYLLYAFHWDDNYCIWLRNSWGAMNGATSLNDAANNLLNKLAKDHLREDTDGSWRSFLEQFLFE